MNIDPISHVIVNHDYIYQARFTVNLNGFFSRSIGVIPERPRLAKGAGLLIPTPLQPNGPFTVVAWKLAAGRTCSSGGTTSSFSAGGPSGASAADGGRWEVGLSRVALSAGGTQLFHEEEPVRVSSPDSLRK